MITFESSTFSGSESSTVMMSGVVSTVPITVTTGTTTG